MVAMPPPPFPPHLALPVVTSESLWEGAPAGEPGDGGWQRCGVVPRPGEAELSRAPPGQPSRPSTTTSGRRGPGTHPEPLLLPVPAPSQPGRAVQLQQSLQNLLPWAGQHLLSAPGRGPRDLGGFGVPKASLLPVSTGKPWLALLSLGGKYPAFWALELWRVGRHRRERSPLPFLGGCCLCQLGATTLGTCYPLFHGLRDLLFWELGEVAGTALRVALFLAPYCGFSLNFPPYY